MACPGEPPLINTSPPGDGTIVGYRDELFLQGSRAAISKDGGEVVAKGVETRSSCLPPLPEIEPDSLFCIKIDRAVAVQAVQIFGPETQGWR